MMRRHEVTDQQWSAIEHLLPGQEGDPGATAKDNCLFVNAVMWIAKTGAPWRDLPDRFGKWNNVFQRFNRWCKAGVFSKIMEHLLRQRLVPQSPQGETLPDQLGSSHSLDWREDKGLMEFLHSL